MDLVGILSVRRHRHRRIAFVFTAAIIGAHWMIGPFSIHAQALFALGAIWLLGIPHGALDGLIALQMLPRRRRAIILFLVSYVALAALVVLAWATLPVLWLFSFLALSLVHFGAGDRAGATRDGGTAWETGVRGAIPLLMPVAAHPEEVARLFAWLLDAPAGQVEGQLRAFLPIAVSAWGLSFAFLAGLEVCGCRVRRDEAGFLETLLEIPLLVLLFVALPPLFAFATYFCGWHSARHLITVVTLLRSRRVPLAEMARWTGLTLAATALLSGAVFLWATEHPMGDAAVVRGTFVTLAALTLPHALLTSRVERTLGSRAGGWVTCSG